MSPTRQHDCASSLVIEFRNVGKTYRSLLGSSVKAVEEFSLQVPEGEILVLDEPTHGLDPVWTQRFRDIVGQLRRPDRTILIASHNLDELQRLADRVGRDALSTYAGVRLRQILESFPLAEDAGCGEYEVTVGSIQELKRRDGSSRIRGTDFHLLTPPGEVRDSQLTIFNYASDRSQPVLCCFG